MQVNHELLDALLISETDAAEFVVEGDRPVLKKRNMIHYTEKNQGLSCRVLIINTIIQHSQRRCLFIIYDHDSVLYFKIVK